ncbi:MAG TPA: cupin domain-containing protein [Rhizomicrobium sp.]|nr:cupin domain-containing protein [Rhizomicrobium sp.]
MTGFDQVVAPLGTDAFLKNYWLKSFVHIPGPPGRFTDLLTWNELNSILEQHRLMPPRLKLYKDGQAIDPAQYLTPAIFGVPRLDAGGLVASLAHGASLILDDAQEVAPRVRGLMQSFQDALHTDAFANLYAGWHSHRAFHIHWDPQEAFVIQLCGRKRWQVYQPTRQHPLKNDIEPPPQPTSSPVWEGVLADGDALYIPRGWWHEAFPLNEPSLHLTISLTPPTAMDYLGWVMSRLRRHSELRASLPVEPKAQDEIANIISRSVTDALHRSSLEDFLREWDANIRPNPHIRLPTAPYDQLLPIHDDSRVRLASLHRLPIVPHGEHFEFSAAGRLWTVPASLQPALAMLHNARAFTLAELTAGLATTSAKDDLLKSLGVLARAGVVLVERY